MNLKKICLFCGSRSGSHYKWSTMAKELGEKVAKNNWEIVYGGGRWGLMGETAEAALRSGSKVTGIITNELLNTESSPQNLNDLIVVNSMSERKKQMIELADVFLVLPGGIGTLDELFEVWTTKQLSQHSKPIILLNFESYFDSLIVFIEKTVDEGFLTDVHMEHLIVCETVDEVVSKIFNC